MTAFDPTRTKPRSTKVAREVYELVTEARRLLIAHGIGVLPPELHGDAFATTTDRHGQQKHPGLSDVFGLGARMLLAEIKRRIGAPGRTESVHVPARRVTPPAMVDALAALGKEADAKQAEAMRELAEAEERLRQREANAPTKKRRGR